MLLIKQSYLFGLVLLSFIFCINSCSSIEDTTLKDKKNKSQDIFIRDSLIHKHETYASIKGSAARLRALLSGEFVQYTRDPESKKFRTWLVNDGTDSIVLYQLPVGNPNRDGYWLYQYQYLTSLPDEPAFQAFLKIEKVNRDTIKAIYYNTPENFKITLATLLKDETVFDEINWKELKEKTENNVTIYYVRQSPISFIGESNDWRKTKMGFKNHHLTVSPEKTILRNRLYDENKKTIGLSVPNWLVKTSRVREDLLY